MKMITAIVHKKDAANVCSVLSQNGFEFTKLATTGGFLKTGNTTLLIGTDDDKVDRAVELIRLNCAKRTEPVASIDAAGAGVGVPLINPFPAEVIVGGAIVFVTDVAYYEKM